MALNQLRGVEALKFAVEFAQADLSAVNVADMNDKVIQFAFQRQPVGTTVSPRMSRSDLNNLRLEVLAVLTSMVEGQPCQVHLSLRRLIGRRGSKAIVVWDGAIRDRFLHWLIQLLEETGLDKLKTCPDPACGRLFLKVTRKTFCSTQCQSRFYMREVYRKDDHGKTTRTR